MQRRERKPAACRIAHEGDAPGIETPGEPAIGLDRILERGGKRMLRREPVIDKQHACARRDCDPPSQIAVKRRGAEHVAAAVEIENVAVVARLAGDDANSLDPAGIDRDGLRA